MTKLPAWLDEARRQWRWQGQERPPFADEPGPGQVSVWDFPRPPRIVQDPREVVLRWGELDVARTHHALFVQETGHPPSVYLPWRDVARELLVPAGSGSFCEWKGEALYWTLAHGDRRLPRVAWSYPQPLPGAEALLDHVAFYPVALQARVGGQPVTPQPGGFYGGWITPDLAGPFKGARGSEGW